jgi:ABC-type transporter Mla subunit MlaD
LAIVLLFTFFLEFALFFFIFLLTKIAKLGKFKTKKMVSGKGAREGGRGGVKQLFKPKISPN